MASDRMFRPGRSAALAAVLALTLAGCGLDGPPEPPKSAAGTGFSVSGTAEMGVVGGNRP
ncbi:argininosuccinate lyase [Rhodovulum kholense]|uniref:argininosuccinate lyase n=1 Tax=Rhodovulum kholense TaxID=453584 RepID=UPI001FE3BBCB|nr:argininosuccinate lyase [Rhodovulum kholense]